MRASWFAPPDRSSWNTGLQDGLLTVLLTHTGWQLWRDLDAIDAILVEAKGGLHPIARGVPCN